MDEKDFLSYQRLQGLNRCYGARNACWQSDRKSRPYHTMALPRHACMVGATLAVALGITIASKVGAILEIAATSVSPASYPAQSAPMARARRTLASSVR